MKSQDLRFGHAGVEVALRGLAVLQSSRCERREFAHR